MPRYATKNDTEPKLAWIMAHTGDSKRTTEGRIIACVLMTAGAGLFATLTGLIASTFLQSRSQESELKQLTEEVRTLSQKIDAIMNRPE
jgi:hypothetical protein